MRFLFRLAVSTWKKICVNIQHEICMHGAVTQDLSLLLPHFFFSLPLLPSLSFLFAEGVYFKIRLCYVAQADHQICSDLTASAS